MFSSHLGQAIQPWLGHLPNIASPACKPTLKVLLNSTWVYQSRETFITTKYFIFIFCHYDFFTISCSRFGTQTQHILENIDSHVTKKLLAKLVQMSVTPISVLSVRLSVFLCVSLLYFSMFILLPFLSIHPSFLLSFCLSVCLFYFLCSFMYVCLSFFLSLCFYALFFYLSILLSSCVLNLYVCLSALLFYRSFFVCLVTSLCVLFASFSALLLYF